MTGRAFQAENPANGGPDVNLIISVVAGRAIPEMLPDFIVLLMSLVDYANGLALGAHHLPRITNFDASANAYKVLDVFL